MGTYYKQVEKFLDQIDSGAWVEIGVDRGEGSTKFFADHAGSRNCKFYGVDADPAQITQATKNLATYKNAIFASDGTMSIEYGKVPDYVNLIHAKGEDFLQQCKQELTTQKISLVYLDNFDWDYWVGGEEESFVPAQKQHYRDTMGVEMTNLASQQAHLLQAMLLIPMMSKNNIIVCDDTWYHPREGVFIGKCSAVVPYLLLNGYKILHSEGYRQNSGLILGRL